MMFGVMLWNEPLPIEINHDKEKEATSKDHTTLPLPSNSAVYVQVILVIPATIFLPDPRYSSSTDTTQGLQTADSRHAAANNAVVTPPASEFFIISKIATGSNFKGCYPAILVPLMALNSCPNLQSRFLVAESTQDYANDYVFQLGLTTDN